MCLATGGQRRPPRTWESLLPQGLTRQAQAVLTWAQLSGCWPVMRAACAHGWGRGLLCRVPLPGTPAFPARERRLWPTLLFLCLVHLGNEGRDERDDGRDRPGWCLSCSCYNSAWAASLPLGGRRMGSSAQPSVVPAVRGRPCGSL